MNLKPITLLAIALLNCADLHATSSLRLMTYNIHSGFPMGKNSKNHIVTESDVRNISDVISSASADIVALQEVQCEWGLASQTTHTTSYLNEPRLLAAFTNMHYVFGSSIEDEDYPTTNQEYLEWGTPDRWVNNGAQHGEFGNAVLSTGKLTKPPQNIGLPNEPGKEPRACLRVEVEVPGYSQPVVVYATHLAHDSPRARAKQFNAILDHAVAEPKNRVVFVMGDLNSSADAASEKLLPTARLRGFHDLHLQFAAQLGGKPDPTVPADNPERRIDYVLCNQPLNVLEARVIPSLASDHLALLVEVALPSGSTMPPGD